MASPFSESAQLKNLKKELEKKESAQDTGPKINMEPRRPRVKTPKSREEMLGEQTARETGLRVGMRVTLMDSNDSGVIKAVRKDHVVIDLDGLDVPVPLGGFIVNDEAEDARMRATAGRDKERRQKPTAIVKGVPDEVTVDLHIERIPGGLDAPKGFELPFQLDYFRRVIRQYRKHRGIRINVVHGVGDGILRDAVRREVDETFALTCSWSPGIAGVTIVTVK